MTKRRLLIVAMANSIHTARWIGNIDRDKWDVRLFPSIDIGNLHPDLRAIDVYHSVYSRQNTGRRKVRFHGLPVFFEPVAETCRAILCKLLPQYRGIQLLLTIKIFRPHIIHSMEIQSAGYLTLGVKKHFPGHFPPWIVTNWGSDIYFYGRLRKHQDRIKGVMEHCDFYKCEGNRDVTLARQFGFKGTVLPVFPNTGGFKVRTIKKLRAKGPTSKRRIIMLKGYQHWAGRALVGLRALEICADKLKGYKVVIYSAASNDVRIAVELFEASTGIPVYIIPLHTPHQKILKLHGQARISLGLSISDAISTSVLEAMAMGSFPIQSFTSCADEWIKNGKNGFLVPPEDSTVVAKAISQALTDDKLVDEAAAINAGIVAERLSYGVIRQKVASMYDKVYNLAYGKSIK